MVNRTQILILLVYLTFSCTTSDSDPGKKSGASVAENSQENRQQHDRSEPGGCLFSTAGTLLRWSCPAPHSVGLTGHF